MEKAKVKSFSLYITEDLKDFLTQISDSRGIPRNALISNILWEYKEKIENEQKNR